MNRAAESAPEGNRLPDHLYRTMVECSPHGVFMVDYEGWFVHTNAAFTRLTGYAQDDLLTRNLGDISPSAAVELNRSLTEGRSSAQVTCLHADGSPRWIALEIMRFDDASCLGYAVDVTVRMEAETVLKRREAQLRAIFDTASDLVFLKDVNRRYTRVNAATLEFLSRPLEAILGVTDDEFYSADVARRIEQMDLRVLEGEIDKTTLVVEMDGRDRIMETIKVPMRDDHGEVVGLCGVSRDITELRQMEDQLRQAQKMEAVGRLAGGVAHDFNNLLTPILGYTGLLQQSLPKDTPEQHDLAAIDRAALRARDLTLQLLAFGRKQVLDMRVVSLNLVIEETSEILRRLLRENIQIRYDLVPDLGMVRADVSQLHTVLINLAVNAADAMRDGGVLAVETQNVTLDAAYAHAHPASSTGPHVMIAVTDDGCGIAPETVPLIFEPFFTTKSVDEGTGLGLASVHGIVNQHKGSIQVYSERGRGTTFKLYLPRVEASPRDGDEEEKLGDVAGHERVLVVEDDEAVRKLTEAVLRKYGYDVVAVASPAVAIESLSKEAEGFDLLLSDVVMPGMNGMQLHHTLCGVWPDIPVLFMSGYTSNVIEHHGVLAEGMNFIQKPFTPLDLMRRVRAVLDD